MVNDWVYYRNDSNIYKIRIDGTERTHVVNDSNINSNVDGMIVAGGWVYYKDSWHLPLYMMRTDGTDQQLISENVISLDAFFSDGIIYHLAHSDGKVISSLSFDGRMRPDIECSDYGQILAVEDGWILRTVPQSGGSVTGEKKQMEENFFPTGCCSGIG